MNHAFSLVPVLLAELAEAPKQESLLSLVLSAGIFVQLILFGLLAMSVLTWAIIFFKRKILREAEEHSESFARSFEDRTALSDLYEAAQREQGLSAAAAVLCAGYEEAKRENGTKGNLEGRSRRVERALKSAVDEEIARLERRLPFLATTGSTAPFIGLFGTVWGIMRSFRDIGQLHSADLSVVAPGIAEALIATAVGLFAAIPAVMAYNTFLNRIRSFRRALESFADAALSRIEREWPS
ncbi:MAG: protein TolQ [Bdellovibrionota bacterium]